MSKSVHYMTIDRDGNMTRHYTKPTTDRVNRRWVSKSSLCVGHQGVTFPTYWLLFCEIPASFTENQASLAINQVRRDNGYFTLAEEKGLEWNGKAWVAAQF
jgi:hypothetical protein